MSLSPKNEWTDWAAEWGMQHLPQKDRLYRDEGIVGIREERLVQVGWGGEHNASLVVLIRFPQVEDVARLRDALIADPTLDGLPSKGAKRRKMQRETERTTSLTRRSLPEFTLGERSLRWVRLGLWSSPNPAKARAWVEMLLGAVVRNTQPFDGHCERCNASGVRGLVLVDRIPMILCSSCQQHLRAEGEMAERSYDLQDANHVAGAIRALLVAFVVAVVWAILDVATGLVFGALAMFAGLIVARAYRSGAGRIDTPGRVISAAITLGSVVVGDLLAITIRLWRHNPAANLPFAKALTLYTSSAMKSPGRLGLPICFGLLGVWMSTLALRRPHLRVDIRSPADDPRKGPEAA